MSTRKQTYDSWYAAKRRCTDSRHDSYPNYGGRGIRMCDRWMQSFDNFLEDMGLKPAGTSLDRIDNDDHYCLSNCRWATHAEQQLNKRNSLPNPNISFIPGRNKWRVRKTENGHRIHVGYFSTLDRAIEAA